MTVGFFARIYNRKSRAATLLCCALHCNRGFFFCLFSPRVYFHGEKCARRVCKYLTYVRVDHSGRQEVRAEDVLIFWVVMRYCKYSFNFTLHRYYYCDLIIPGKLYCLYFFKFYFNYKDSKILVVQLHN